MATRTTIEEVKKILGTTELSDGVLEAYIEDANVYINEILKGKGLSEPVLTTIEKWVTAHMITITQERAAKEEGAGGAYIKYAGEWGTGLSSSSYGQMAMNLDPTNTLLYLDMGIRHATSRAVKSFRK